MHNQRDKLNIVNTYLFLNHLICTKESLLGKMIPSFDGEMSVNISSVGLVCNIKLIKSVQNKAAKKSKMSDEEHLSMLLITSMHIQ